MNRKRKPRTAGLTLDGLVTALLVVTTAVLFSASYINKPVSPEDRAREHAEFIASAANSATARGSTKLSDAQNIVQVVDLISAGVTVSGGRDLGFATVRGPSMTDEEREEALRYLSLEDGVVHVQEPDSDS